MKIGRFIFVLGAIFFQQNISSQAVYNGSTKHIFTTNHGKIEIGPFNTSWGHIYTDRPKIIFNKDVYTTTNGFSSYNNDLILKTEGTERLRINDDTGNVGIGTNAPTAKLDLRGDFYMNAGEGFKMFGDINYFGQWQDGIVFEMRDTNASNGGTDGGFVFRGYTPTDDVHKDWMVIKSAGGGRVGIGTTSPDSKLSVNGNIHAKEVKVDLIGWPDYVFNNKYILPTLEEIEKHIQEKGHLINIPSAEEVKENGIQLGEMNKLLLEKVEELTLYTLQQQKELENQKTINQKLEERILQIENTIKTNEREASKK